MSHPLYRHIAETLAEAIRSGSRPVGSVLPTEVELASCFRASRHTIREALRVLAEQGLVARRQGSGTVVRSSEPVRRASWSIGSLADLMHYAVDSRFDIADAGPVRVDSALAEVGGIPIGETWLRIDGVRRARGDGTPICRATVLLQERFAPVLGEIRADGGAIYKLIERRFGVPVRALRQEIKALPMPSEVARQLRRRRGGLAMRVVRRYLDDRGEPVEIAINVHPADAFTHRIELTLEDPA